MTEQPDRWFSRPYSDGAEDVTEFVLSAPDEGNRQTVEMISRLADALEATVSAGDCRVVVLSAEGDDFCLGRAGTGPSLEFAPDTARDLINQIEGSLMKLFDAIKNAPVPVVSIIRGRAVGFGCALAVACDLTIAGPTAAFQLDEMGHGKPPLMAMSTLSPYVPEKALAAMVYTTDPVTGVDATMLGLASLRTETDEELAAKSSQVIDGLRAMPPEALRTVKEFLGSADIEPKARARMALAMFANAVTG